MEQINLNLIPNGVNPVAHCKQYDVGRTFRCNLFEGTSVYTLDGTETVECEVHKPDGNLVTLALTNTGSTYVDVTTTLQMCACSGESLAAIKITSGGVELGSLNFVLYCERSPLEGGVTSDSGIYNLETQVSSLVASEVANQYDSANVIFDSEPTAGHGNGYAVTSEGIVDYVNPEATIENVSIASFDNGGDGVPVKELIVGIEPVQSLNGYDKPWVGGAGKNLLNYAEWKTLTSIARGTAVFENNGVTLTATANDAYTDFSNTGFPVNARVPVSEGDTITLSWEETTNTSGTVIIFPNGLPSGYVSANNDTNKKLSYTATSGVTYVSFRFGVTNNGDTIAYKNIQIEKGSMATAFEPYANICPITGWSSANVVATSKNLISLTQNTVQADRIGGITINSLDDNAINMTSQAIVWRCFGRFVYLEAGTYTLSFKATSSDSYDPKVIVYDSNNAEVCQNITQSTPKSFVVTESQIMEIRMFASMTDATARTVSFYDIQLEAGSTPTTFEPYGTCHTISLGQTVYGGELNVTTGELKITRGIVDLGALTWTLSVVGNNRNRFNGGALTNVKAPATNGNKVNGICSAYEIQTANYLYSTSGVVGLDVEMYGNLQVYDDNYNDAAAFKTAMNGQKFVYELATPTTTTLTPTEVATVLGYNNIFADTGDVVSVTYIKDTASAIYPIVEDKLADKVDKIPSGYQSIYGTWSPAFNGRCYLSCLFFPTSSSILAVGYYSTDGTTMVATNDTFISSDNNVMTIFTTDTACAGCVAKIMFALS